jgi:hypothetical protein
MGMDANKHTALPYRTTNIRGEMRDQHGFIVADCQKQEDAEFIVRACNSHSDLVTAVERLLNCMKLARWEDDDTAVFARAALSRATQSNHAE